MEARLDGAAELIRAIVSVLWVVLAFLVFWSLRAALAGRVPFLTKLGISPTGLTAEFAEQKLTEAVRRSDERSQRAIGQSAKRNTLERLERNADLLGRARILWVDDHPEKNQPLVDLLRRYGATVDTPRTNQEALALLEGSRYDVVISDVARDDEGMNSPLKGVEFAETVFDRWQQRPLLLSARFDPTQVPGMSVEERLALTRRVEATAFARTNRVDEALQYIVDLVERSGLASARTHGRW